MIKLTSLSHHGRRQGTFGGFGCIIFCSCLSAVRAFSSTTASVASSPRAAGFVKNVAVPGLKNGMDYVKLGDSDLVVSKVCMGTMTIGQQNTLEQGVEMLNKVFDDYGVNFLDTAEMYPIPTKRETQGDTDRAVCEFLKTRNREDVILATKVAGRSKNFDYLPRREPGTTAALTREQILDSVYASLERLGTDYIDLLQLHWPDRPTGGLFGAPDFSAAQYEQAVAGGEEGPVPFQEQLSALQELVSAGKVRHVGVSNETPYGVSSFCHLASTGPDKYPKIRSIQNSYSLVVRKDYEAGLTETCYHHNVGLLAYSPLAGGSLTGKYQDPDHIPAGARLTLFPGYMERYLDSQNKVAVQAYCDLAQSVGLTPAQLALSWCYHNPAVASTIIGTTTNEQVVENVASYDITLEEDVLDEIRKIYRQYTDPTKMR